MPVTRRGFFGIVGAARGPLSGDVLAARGLEAHFAEAWQQSASVTPGQPPGQTPPPARTPRPPLTPGVEEIRINSNENPLGPGKVALDAILAAFPNAGRYPFNATPAEADLMAALQSKFKVKAENLVLGAGSQEILKSAMRAWTSPERALVAGAPTFENCTGFAKKYGHGLTEIRVDAAFRLDIEPTIAAAKGAGLVFFNNPNNPTATVHGAKTVADMVHRIRKASPDTVILIDEAYHDYVTDPSYASAVPLALSTPNVFVARTLSKAYGMAGMRIGYAIGMADTMKPLIKLRQGNNVSVLGIAAAVASLNDPKHIVEESARNTAVRAFTVKALKDMGCKPTDSQANFLFVDIGGPAKDFRDECAKSGVMVGRDFPPFEKTHCRISIGTMAEMQKATDVFRKALATTQSANRGK